MSGLGKSPRGRNDKPLQYSSLESLIDWGAWWAEVHWVAKSQTWFNHWKFTHTFLNSTTHWHVLISTAKGNYSTSSNATFSSVQLLSRVQLCDPMDCSTPDFPVHHQLPGTYSNSCLSRWWCHPTISSSVAPFSSCLQSSSASGSFQMVSSSHQVAKALEFQLQHQSFQWTLRNILL